MILQLLIPFLVYLGLLPGADDSFMSHVSGNIVTTLSDKSKEIAPVEGAVVTIVSGKDTLHTVSDKDGAFKFEFNQSFGIDMNVSCMGYENFRNTYQLSRDWNYILVHLKPEELDAAKIKGDIPFVRVDKDTTIYNAAAIERMDGDKAIQLLMQIPGVSIKDGILYVGNKAIEKTYVNGKLIYGDNPMKALALLGADDVKNIKVYDKQKELDKQRGLKESEKIRVLNLETFTKFYLASDLSSQARGGTDGERDSRDGTLNHRYSAGAQYDYNTEMLQIALDANTNNLNDNSNDFSVISCNSHSLNDERNSKSAQMEVTKKWKDAEWGNLLGMEYKHNSDDSEYNYRKTVDRYDNPRHYEESRITNSKGKSDDFSVWTSFRKTPIKDIYLAFDFSTDENTSTNKDIITNLMAGNIEQSQNQIQMMQDQRHSFSNTVSWSNPYAGNYWMPKVRMSMEREHNPSTTLVLDTLESSFNKRYLVGDDVGDSNHYDINIYFSKSGKTKDETAFLTEYITNVTYDKRNQNCMTIGRLASINHNPDSIDLVNSCRYTWNDISISSCLRRIVNKSGLNFSSNLNMSYIIQKDNEFFPLEVHENRHYLIPKFTYIDFEISSYELSIEFEYFIDGRTPSIEQTRQRITNYNPLMLQMGNPSLKAPIERKLRADISSMQREKGNSFRAQTVLIRYSNAIIDKVTYFTSPETIDAWGTSYDIQPGTTCSIRLQTISLPLRQTNSHRPGHRVSDATS